MRVKITVTDDDGHTATYEGTSDDNFDCWEAGLNSSHLNNDAHFVLDAMQTAAYEHVTGKR